MRKRVVLGLVTGMALMASAEIRVGVIGLDTSHAIAFTKAMNVDRLPSVEGLRVVAAHQWGSRDIVSATNRYPKYVSQMKDMGVEIVPSVDALLAKVDCVCLETNDGREHLWQAEKVFRAGKPVFIDKPLAHNLRDALKIVALGQKYKAKYFTTSALRYSSANAEVSSGKYGRIRGLAYATPSPLEVQGTHGRYSWYGIHGFEPVVAIMGTGAETVRTFSAGKVDEIVITWKDGRTATLRATQDDWNAYGGVAFPEKGKPVALSGYEGYGKLLEHIAAFFRTGVSPVPTEQTVEIMALMEAAELSQARGGEPVAVADVLAAEPWGPVAGADWIPFAPEPDIAEGSALDFSAFAGGVEPAGAYGRVVVRNGHFEFERKPGVPQRFLGANVCMGCCFPSTMEKARRLARNIRRAGYNSIRLHHFDRTLTAGPEEDGALKLEPKAVGQLDMLMAAAIEQGLYVTADFFIGRLVPWRSVGDDKPGRVGQSKFKDLVYVHEGLTRNLEQFISNFLGHVNPLTGRRYGDEPALAWIGLVNESAPYCCASSDPLWHAAWKAYLAERKAADPEGWGDVPEALPKDGWGGTKQVSALFRFFGERERLFAERLRRHVRETCRSQVLLSCSNGGFHPAPDFLPRASPACYDYVDDHYYFDHPTYPVPWNRMQWTYKQTNPVRGWTRGLPEIALRRIFGRPFTVTEFNYPGLNRFRAGNGLVFGAAAAGQDWDGLWRFEWSAEADSETIMGRVVTDSPQHERTFDVSGDPVLLASERAIAALFLRGDLAPIPARAPVVYRPSEFVRPFAHDAEVSHGLLALAVFGWHYRIGAWVGETPPADAVRTWTYPDCYRRKWSVADLPSETPDAPVRVDQKAGSFVVVTPRTCGAFGEGGRFDAGTLKATLAGAPAAVWATSLDAKPLAESRRVLLTHLTNVLAEGMTFSNATCRTLLKLGKGSYLMAAGSADVRLGLAPGRWRAYALTPGGRRRNEVPVRMPAEGGLAIRADVAANPKDASYLYELTCE